MTHKAKTQIIAMIRLELTAPRSSEIKLRQKLRFITFSYSKDKGYILNMLSIELPLSSPREP
jgi:hypothetical protein